jgi:hypothetical protein
MNKTRIPEPPGSVTDNHGYRHLEAAAEDRRQWNREAADIHRTAATVAPPAPKREPRRRTEPDEAVIASETMRLLAGQPRSAYTIREKVEGTFGPNPCTSRKFLDDDGNEYGTVCDLKRCAHCGPRKELLMTLQLRAGFGDAAWIATIHRTCQCLKTGADCTHDPLDEWKRAYDAAKKRAQRAGVEPPEYQIVGDDGVDGRIVVSAVQVIPGQRHAYLSDWLRRITERYRAGTERLRRSYRLGRIALVSRVAQIRRGQLGTRSRWRYKRHVTARDMEILAVIRTADLAPKARPIPSPDAKPDAPGWIHALKDLIAAEVGPAQREMAV